MLTRKLIALGLLSFLTTTGCAYRDDTDLMEVRSPDTLLTSFMIANGMARHALLRHILKGEAGREDIARLIATDHNTWFLIREAVLHPSVTNMRKADAGLRQVLAFISPTLKVEPGSN